MQDGEGKRLIQQKLFSSSERGWQERERESLSLLSLAVITMRSAVK